jgi:hypothetical protein
METGVPIWGEKPSRGPMMFGSLVPAGAAPPEGALANKPARHPATDGCGPF